MKQVKKNIFMMLFVLTVMVWHNGAKAEDEMNTITGKASPRIVGGTEASTTDWPWMAGVLYSDRISNYNAQYCGASVIDNYWVVTAAHCIKEGSAPQLQPQDIEILVGAHDLRSNEGRRIKVKRIILHPDFNPSTYNNDMALIELAAPAETETLPIYESGGDLAGMTATALGWGYTRPDDSFSAASKLQQVNLPVVTNEQCDAAFYEEITGTMMCAGYLSGGKDTCQGDSGGPLVVNINSKWVLAGVTSWGEGCAKPGYYGVYARVSKLKDFIRQYVPAPQPPPDDDTEPVTPKKSSSSSTCFIKGVLDSFL